MSARYQEQTSTYAEAAEPTCSPILSWPQAGYSMGQDKRPIRASKTTMGPNTISEIFMATVPLRSCAKSARPRRSFLCTFGTDCQCALVCLSATAIACTPYNATVTRIHANREDQVEWGSKTCESFLQSLSSKGNKSFQSVAYSKGERIVLLPAVMRTTGG